MHYIFMKLLCSSKQLLCSNINCLLTWPKNISVMHIVCVTPFFRKTHFHNESVCKMILILNSLPSDYARITFCFPGEFHTRYKYENNTSPCGRWHAMFSQALHKARGA